jgi:hypothetical protein
MREWLMPASGPDRFLGRTQSLATLTRWLRGGDSVSVIGGAKMGKSSLLGEAARRLGSAAVLVGAAEITAGSGAVREIAAAIEASGSPAGERSFLLVDDAGKLADPSRRRSLDELAILGAEGIGGRRVSICLAGSRRWRDAALDPGCPLSVRGVRLRSLPLAPWDRRSVGDLLRRLAPDATSADIGRLIGLSGNHPFLLKGLLSRWPDLERALTSFAVDFEEAFASWSEEMSPDQADAVGEAAVDARPLFRYLAQRGSPVGFDGARRALGRKDLKREADVLRLLGVIDRRLHGEEATAVLHASCGLFNGWYLEHRMGA